MTRILILGASGMLGHKLAQVLASASGLEVHGAVRSPPPEAFCHPSVRYRDGITVGANDIEQLRSLIADVRPGVIINALGVIKQHKDQMSQLSTTFFLNGTLPHLLAHMAAPSARVIHVSTDCVYVGDRGRYAESERPDAEDVYGRSKAMGELDYGRHLTIRTSIIGPEVRGHHGLLGWLLSQPGGSRLRGWTRAIFSGLPTITLARTVRDLILGDSQLSGLYHVASEPIDKFQLLSRINGALALGHTIEEDSSMVIDRSLDDRRFRAATSTTVPDWGQLISELVDDVMAWPYQREYPALAAAAPQV